MEQDNSTPITLDIVAYRKQYYNNNKDKHKVHIICDICGGKYHLYNKSNHYKLKKHMKIMEKIENEKVKDELQNLKDQIKLGIIPNINSST